jgi:hypothetical protein
MGVFGDEFGYWFVTDFVERHGGIMVASRASGSPVLVVARRVGIDGREFEAAVDQLAEVGDDVRRSVIVGIGRGVLWLLDIWLNGRLTIHGSLPGTDLKWPHPPV